MTFDAVSNSPRHSQLNLVIYQKSLKAFPQAPLQLLFALLALIYSKMMLYTQLLNYLDPGIEIAVGHQTLSNQIFKMMKKKVLKGHNIL